MSLNLGTRRRLGAVAWGIGLVVALFWTGVRGGSAHVKGIGWAPPVHVSPYEPGQIASLEVQLHDVVQAGQIVARLDDTPLVEEREVVSAQLLAAQEAQSNEVLIEARRFAQGRESTLLDRATVATQLFEDEAMLAALQEQLSIEQDLLDHRATSTQMVLDLERQIRVVQARITAGREALRVATEAASAADERSAGAPQANQWEVVAVARMLEAIDGRIQRTRLASSIDGQVTAIYATPGEVVQPSQPVLQVRRISTDEVVAWAPASAAARLQPGRTARVVRADGEVQEARIVSVGRGVQPLPLSLLVDPQRVEFGVPVRLVLNQGTIAPDEPVAVRL